MPRPPAAKRTPVSPPDWGILALTGALVVAGWLILYSASALTAESRFNDQYFFLKRQMIWSVIGMVALLAASRVPLSLIQRWARPAFLGVLVLLVLVLVVGHEVGGARRWLRFGGLGLQPSEFAKLAMVCLLADHLDRKRSRLGRFWDGYVPALTLVGSALLLILLERDLGTPFLIGMVSLSLIFIAGAKPGHLLVTALAALPVLYLAVFHVAYRRQRFLAFLDPWAHAQGVGYQLVESLLALGSGGLFGKGVGASTIKMHYMPESQTDFIFPIFAEEFGFLGAILLTGLFFLLAHRCLRAGLRATHWFHALLAMGVGLLLGGQVLVNLGVVTGLLPTKGMPLPFISFGGSSTVVMLAAVGLVMNVTRQRGTPILGTGGREGFAS